LPVIKAELSEAAFPSGAWETRIKVSSILAAGIGLAQNSYLPEDAAVNRDIHSTISCAYSGRGRRITLHLKESRDG
jgi:hypothetical protein